MSDYKPHPYANLLPMMSDAELQSLKTDISANGQRDDIILFDGKILDGRNRDKVMDELGLFPRYKNFTGDDAAALAFVYSKANHRNMSESQKACAAMKFMPHFDKGRKNKPENGNPEPVPGSVGVGAKGDTRDLAGGLFGVSGRYVSDAKLVFEADPKLFLEVFEGRLPLTRAKRVVHRAAHSRRLRDRAKLSPTTGNAEIITADCLECMEQMAGGAFHLIFADPPYNIGIDYGKGSEADRRKPREYMGWVRQLLNECYRLLRPDGSMWVMISDEFAAQYRMSLDDADFTIRAWVKWYETFGNNCSNNFNRTSRHLFYCVKDPEQFVFNPDVFSRPSDRQSKYNDPRAVAGGKLWDDVWQIPRLVENAKERVPGFPTQIPLALVEPIVRGCSEPGDWVFDPFTGSGTTAEAAVMNRRKFVGTEISKEYAEMARLRVRAAIGGRTANP